MDRLELNAVKAPIYSVHIYIAPDDQCSFFSNHSITNELKYLMMDLLAIHI